MHTTFWWGNLKDEVFLTELGISRKKTLRWVLKKWRGRAWNGFMCLKIRNKCFKHDDKTFSSI